MKKVTQDCFDGQHFFVGIDVHKNNWVVSIRWNAMELRTLSMNPLPSDLSKFMEKNYPGGIYHSVYEAGFCGFWIHEQLCALRFDNRVVNPVDVPTMGKEKTGKRGNIPVVELSVNMSTFCHCERSEAVSWAS